MSQDSFSLFLFSICTFHLLYIVSSGPMGLNSIYIRSSSPGFFPECHSNIHSFFNSYTQMSNRNLICPIQNFCFLLSSSLLHQLAVSKLCQWNQFTAQTPVLGVCLFLILFPTFLTSNQSASFLGTSYKIHPKCDHFSTPPLLPTYHVSKSYHYLAWIPVFLASTVVPLLPLESATKPGGSEGCQPLPASCLELHGRSGHLWKMPKSRRH